MNSTKPINIFCFLGKTGSGKSEYINSIIDNSKFMKDNNLSLLVYGTTRKKRTKEVEDVDYHFISKEEFDNIPETDLVECRTYYKFDEGEVKYFTKNEYFDINNNIICITSPYQYESYRNWIAKENIKHPGKYNLFLIIIDTDVATRVERCIKRSSRDDTVVYETCRRILEERNEFENVAKRVPELKDIMIYNTNCYINNNNEGTRFIKRNLEKIKVFISKNCK